MHNDLIELGWTESHWNRICGAVTEEAQKARITAQMLPMVGPEEGSTLAVPQYRLGTGVIPSADAYGAPPDRLVVDSSPTLYLSTIAVNVALRSHEAADPNLNAALGMFRRAASCIARVEDALVFNGRPANGPPPGVGNLPPVFTVSGDGPVREGLTRPLVIPNLPPRAQRIVRRLNPAIPPLNGTDVVDAIIDVIGDLDARGHQGPYACALSQDLFALVCSPTPNLVLPRDRVLPFLQGPLLRASALQRRYGVVVALGGTPVELVVGSDISVRYLQTTPEPRYMFRVCERVALRIREYNAIAVIT
jgi:uncharacterized linocin/CFP29 family protein